MFGLEAYTPSDAAGWLNVGSTLFNVFGSLSKAGQTATMYDYEAKRAAQQAQIQTELGQVTAGRLRTAGKRDVATATASYAASGVDVGEGSPANVVGELSRRIELDALSAMLQGKYKAYDERVAAAGYEAASSNAKASGFWGAGASLLGGFARNQAMKGWGRTSNAGIGHAQNLSYAEGAFPGE